MGGGGGGGGGGRESHQRRGSRRHLRAAEGPAAQSVRDGAARPAEQPSNSRPTIRSTRRLRSCASWRPGSSRRTIARAPRRTASVGPARPARRADRGSATWRSRPRSRRASSNVSRASSRIKRSPMPRVACRTRRPRCVKPRPTGRSRATRRSALEQLAGRPPTARSGKERPVVARHGRRGQGGAAARRPGKAGAVRRAEARAAAPAIAAAQQQLQQSIAGQKGAMADEVKDLKTKLDKMALELGAIRRRCRARSRPRPTRFVAARSRKNCATRSSRRARRPPTG